MPCLARQISTNVLSHASWDVFIVFISAEDCRWLLTSNYKISVRFSFQVNDTDQRLQRGIRNKSKPFLSRNLDDWRVIMIAYVAVALLQATILIFSTVTLSALMGEGAEVRGSCSRHSATSRKAACSFTCTHCLSVVPPPSSFMTAFLIVKFHTSSTERYSFRCPCNVNPLSTDLALLLCSVDCLSAYLDGGLGLDLLLYCFRHILVVLNDKSEVLADRKRLAIFRFMSYLRQHLHSQLRIYRAFRDHLI